MMSRWGPEQEEAAREYRSRVDYSKQNVNVCLIALFKKKWKM